MLGDWADAPAMVLSCPGPLRRHAAALQPVSGLALPQALLGGESQLLAFAAACTGGRLLFAPFPEMFAGQAGLRLALARAGAADAGEVVHLRFGGVRSARVLKGARNAFMLAECQDAPLLTASHHPFASGRLLPASVQRVYRLAPDVVALGRSGGAALPAFDLPDGLVGAGLPSGPAGAPGLEAACLHGFQSDLWASGQPAAGACPPDGTPTVLVPWNLDHPGSILPEMLTRLARLRAPGAPLPRIVLLPFNYIGQTGIIREVIARIREADVSGTALRRLFLARVRSQQGAAALRCLSRVAWVDGNDPEHWWTLGRLAACNIAALLIGAAREGTPGVPAEEALRVRAETRCGALIFQARLPSLRQLPELLRLTDERQAACPPDTPPDNTPDSMPGRPPARRRAKAAA